MADAIGPAVEGLEPAKNFGHWIWAYWREDRDLKDVMNRTLCRAICASDPDNKEVGKLADRIAETVWGSGPKKRRISLRPHKALKRFGSAKWKGTSVMLQVAWPGWREGIQQQMLGRAKEIKLGDPLTDGCREAWPPDVQTLAERVPDKLIAELLEPKRANQTRAKLMRELVQADDIYDRLAKPLERTRPVRFEVSAIGLAAAGAVVAAISELARLKEAVLTAAGALALLALGVALAVAAFLAVQRSSRRQSLKLLNREFARHWAARYLAEITGHAPQPEPHKLNAELDYAFRVAVSTPRSAGLLLGGPNGVELKSLEHDLRERLLPRAASLGDEPLQRSMLELEDALICGLCPGQARRLLYALAAVVAVSTLEYNDGSALGHDERDPGAVSGHLDGPH